MALPEDRAGSRRFEDELSSSRTIVRACILLLIEERASHGYDLLTRLEPLGFERSNPGRVYRALRWLETAQFVQPTWETTGVGPARRVYELSPSGRQALEVSAVTLRRQAKSVDDRLARYIVNRLRALSNDMQAFEFTVEARLAVQATDETAARRKLERLFGPRQVLDADVRTTGGASIRTSAQDGAEPAR